MAARKRDYKKEYAQRVAKAKREGFKGYGEKRRIRRRAVEKIINSSPNAKRKTVTRNVGRMTYDMINELMRMDAEQIRHEAKTNSYYHYK